jgi:hypothetical protein
MSSLNSLGLGRARRGHAAEPTAEYVMVRRPLQRVLAFTGRSIDDIVNSPIVKNQVLGYYKLHKWVDRETEIAELEKAWNPLGRGRNKTFGTNPE